MKTGRNAPCPGGSGKRYKHCCLGNKATSPLATKLLMALVALIMAGGVIAAVVTLRNIEPGMGGAPVKVWSEEHQHYH